MNDRAIPIPALSESYTITLRHIAKFFLYASIFSVVVVMSSTFFPFIGGKYYFFRFTVEMSLLFLILWWGFEAPKNALAERLQALFRQPLFVAVSAFVLSVMLATLFADNPYGAFWSNYERGEGGFQMLHYYAFFALASILFTSPRDWSLALKCSILAAFGMIGYGLLAMALVSGFIGPYSTTTGDFIARLTEPNSRFQGSLGNPAYVAPYLLFSIFFLLWHWTTGTRRGKTWGAIFGTMLFVLFVFFIMSQTRGAFLGLLAGIFVFLGFVAWHSIRLRRIGVIGLGTMIVLGFLVHTFLGGRPELETQIFGGRLLNISITAVSAQTRLWTWGTSFKGFLDRPVFGWGPENFSTVFDKHFDTRHYIAGQNTETWFDRAHSVFFEHLTTLGIVGLLAYLSIFGVFYYQFWKQKRAFISSNYSEKRATIVRALVFAIPVAYLVQNLILFDVLPTYLNLFLFLAFALYEIARSEESIPATP